MSRVPTSRPPNRVAADQFERRLEGVHRSSLPNPSSRIPDHESRITNQDGPRIEDWDWGSFLRLAISDQRFGIPRSLDCAVVQVHAIHMKRTNLVLDEALLEEATRLSGERTYSRTVERALGELVRRIKAKRILEFAGSGAWEGDLSTVREDGAVYRTKRRGAR